MLLDPWDRRPHGPLCRGRGLVIQVKEIGIIPIRARIIRTRSRILVIGIGCMSSICARVGPIAIIVPGNGHLLARSVAGQCYLCARDSCLPRTIIKAIVLPFISHPVLSITGARGGGVAGGG